MGPPPSPCADLSWLTLPPDSTNFVFAFAYVSFVSIVAESFFETSYPFSLFSFVRNRGAFKKCFLCDRSVSRGSQTG